MLHLRHSRLLIGAALCVLGCSGADLGPVGEENVTEASQALVDVQGVLGFESPSYWTASSGTKSSSATKTQGNLALQVSGFNNYVELTSAALTSVSGVSSSIAFDFRPTSNVAWGQAQLYVDAPSRGVYMAYLGQVDLTASTGGVYRSVSFGVPASVLTALSGSYSDLRFKLALNLPSGSGPFLFDNLHFGASTTPSSVTLAVSGVDDFLYVTVGGVRRKVVPIGPDYSEDVSSWFAAGANDVRVQAVNTGGPASYSVQLRVDGQLRIDESCSDAPCESNVTPGAGILFDRSYSVLTPNRPAAQTVSINGTAGAKLYLNDAFTGRSLPTTLSLPQGSYTVGVGVGEGTEGAYAGQYHEQDLLVGAAPLSITPTSAPPLNQPNHTRVAILPIRTTFHGDETPANTGVLLDSDVTVMNSQTVATRDGLMEPFSYNLTTWDITVLPTVENVPFHRGADGGDAPDTGRFLNEAGLTSLHDQYDTVIFFYSRFTASGAGVVNSPCCFWGIGQEVSFMNHMTRGGWPNDYQNFYLLHEMLHDYESYNDWRLRFYNGADGLHGGDEHGYRGGDNGETDFLQWQRRYIRNQVAELRTMRSGVDFTSAPPTSSDLWVGVFDTMRRDVTWSQPSSLQAAASSLLAQRAPRGTPVPTAP